MQFKGLIQFIKILRRALRSLKNNDPLRMAAATAFFTTFALPPILIILIQILGLVLGPASISDHLFEHLGDIIGTDSVAQIKSTLTGFQSLARNWYITIGGSIFLFFVATTLFKVIKDSLNQLWNIKAYPTAGFKTRVKSRLISMAVIVVAGLLFLGVLLAEGLQALLDDYILEMWPNYGSLFFLVMNQVLSVVIVTSWFAVLFKYLSDGNPSWRVTLAGALFTGVFFTIGKLILGWLLTMSNIQNIYGASGSLVLLLLFVFYTSFILYYGAIFTRVWAEFKNQPIEPQKHAYKYQLSEIKKIETTVGG